MEALHGNLFVNLPLSMSVSNHVLQKDSTYKMNLKSSLCSPLKLQENQNSKINFLPTQKRHGRLQYIS